jgi:hypothetical protein
MKNIKLSKFVLFPVQMRDSSIIHALSCPSNTLYWADVGPIEFLVGNIGQLSRLSPDSQPTV